MQDLALYGTTKQKHCKFSISAVCCTNLCTEGIKHDLLQNIPRLIKDTNFIENEYRLRQADVSVTINIRGIPARLLFMNDNPDKDYEDYKKQKTTKSILGPYEVIETTTCVYLLFLSFMVLCSLGERQMLEK